MVNFKQLIILQENPLMCNLRIQNIMWTLQDAPQCIVKLSWNIKLSVTKIITASSGL